MYGEVLTYFALRAGTGLPNFRTGFNDSGITYLVCIILVRNISKLILVSYFKADLTPRDDGAGGLQHSYRVGGLP
jgi:hypothetical protein